MSVIDFKNYKASQNKPKYTSEPKVGSNLYKKNLDAKIKYFNTQMQIYENNPIIENCVFSKEGCAIKFSASDNKTEVLLILQDYSPEEFDTHYVTWEFYIHNIEHDEYLDSRFFSTTDMAVKFFLSKIKYIV